MNKIYNFSAGPSVLPKSVLEKAALEMLNYNGSGQSVMEMSHRSEYFEEIISSCKILLRDIMNIPNNYKILFLQGGASSQFSMIPLNLMNKNKKADFVITGQWAQKAYEEASRYGTANIIASSKDKNFSYIPQLNEKDFDPNADYLHICLNNTIYGTLFEKVPNTKHIPLVADVSSCILSQPLDINQFGVIYAGAQKNMGPAGLTVVIIREDLIGNAMDITPTMFNYKVHHDNNSMYNTPPTYSIYIFKLVLDWIKNEIGGLDKMEQINISKANILYDYIDNSNLFKCTVSKPYRSLMNIPFITGDEKIDSLFINEATKAGFINLTGHRSVGGMRASIYNAMPVEGIVQLTKFMGQFEKNHCMEV